MNSILAMLSFLCCETFRWEHLKQIFRNWSSGLSGTGGQFPSLSLLSSCGVMKQDPMGSSQNRLCPPIPSALVPP